MKKKISIVLFAYNRPSHLRRVLIALENRGINEVNLFVDGPKNNNDKIIQKEIKQTFRNNKFNFKMKKKIFFSKKNKFSKKIFIQKKNFQNINYFKIKNFSINKIFFKKNFLKKK